MVEVEVLVATNIDMNFEKYLMCKRILIQQQQIDWCTGGN